MYTHTCTTSTNVLHKISFNEKDTINYPVHLLLNHKVHNETGKTIIIL